MHLDKITRRLAGLVEGVDDLRAELGRVARALGAGLTTVEDEDVATFCAQLARVPTSEDWESGYKMALLDTCAAYRAALINQQDREIQRLSTHNNGWTQILRELVTGAQRPSSLAKTLGWDRSQILKTLHEMVEIELVQSYDPPNEESDERVCLYTLTVRGHQLTAKLEIAEVYPFNTTDEQQE